MESFIAVANLVALCIASISLVVMWLGRQYITGKRGGHHQPTHAKDSKAHGRALQGIIYVSIGTLALLISIGWLLGMFIMY
jgi:hypothetical protein